MKKGNMRASPFQHQPNNQKNYLFLIIIFIIKITDYVVFNSNSNINISMLLKHYFLIFKEFF